MTRCLTYGAGLLFAALLALSSSAPARADEVMNKAVIDEGHTVYTNHCAVCHGKDGKGGGSMAKFLTIKTPDLTEIAKRNSGTFDYRAVYEKIDGSQMPAAHGDSDMPVWGRKWAGDVTLERSKYLSLLFYLQSIQQK